MLSEDEFQLSNEKIALVYEMEETEQSAQGDKQTILHLMNRGTPQIYKGFLATKQNQILLNLIRELQQYMLSINSGKTDVSMINSD